MYYPRKVLGSLLATKLRYAQDRADWGSKIMGTSGREGTEAANCRPRTGALSEAETEPGLGGVAEQR